jgi:4-hydroxy-tetrahydrodipicolinate reductase
MKINIGVLGSSGRMGKEVLAELESRDGVAILGQWNRRTSDRDLARESRRCDIVIDFSSPDALSRWVRINDSTPTISGTTGLNSSQLAALKRHAKKTRTLHSPNFSIAVYWMTQALKVVQPRWAALGFSASLTECHHIHKKDIPSGTAIRLADAAGFEVENIRSKREGEVVGDHTFHLESDFESLTIVHHAKQRSVFAAGAVDAALWLVQKRLRVPPRLLTMSDFLDGPTSKGTQKKS